MVCRPLQGGERSVSAVRPGQGAHRGGNLLPEVAPVRLLHRGAGGRGGRGLLLWDRLATQLRGEVPRVVWLLPAGGVSIVLIYRICHMERDRGTNLVLVAVREAETMKLRTAPLIFLSTIITHLVGGSAGREGAALQLGGSLAAFVGRQIRLDQKDGRVMVMCGWPPPFLRPVWHAADGQHLRHGGGQCGCDVLRRHCPLVCLPPWCPSR